MLTAPLYPGSLAPEISMAAKRCAGDAYNESILCASVHTATHADAPCHFLDASVDIASMPVGLYIGACFVLALGQESVTPAALAGRVPGGCRRLLLKGDARGYFTPEAAEYLHDLGVELVGTDAWSVGALEEEDAVHQAFLRYPMALLENLELSLADEGWYFLSALPIKIEGSDGAFVRAVLLEDILTE